MDVAQQTPYTCLCCGFPIYAKENFYYSGACEPCVQDEQDRIQKWLDGAPDAVLDERYGGNPNANTRTYNA